MTKGEKLALYTALLAVANKSGASELVEESLRQLGSDLDLQDEPLGMETRSVLLPLVVMVGNLLAEDEATADEREHVLKWTRRYPDDDGYYWFVETDEDGDFAYQPTIVKLEFQEGGKLAQVNPSGGWTEIRYGLWAGPLVVPDLMEGEAP